MALARLGKGVAQVLHQQSRTLLSGGEGQVASHSYARLNGQQTRTMASGGHHGEAVTYAGLTLHKPATWHTVAGTSMCALMWFWILVRAYHDGETFLFGHASHFEHEAKHAAHETHGSGQEAEAHH